MTVHQSKSKTNKKELIVMCAGCSAVKTEGGWIPYNLARFLIDIPKMKSNMRLSHGICKNCALRIYGSAVGHIFDNQTFNK